MNNGISYSETTGTLHACQELRGCGTTPKSCICWKYSRDEGLAEVHYIGYYSFALNDPALT